MPTIGAQNPDLLAKLGLDVDRTIREGQYVGKVCVVTFADTVLNRPPGPDPVALLPPSYTMFGILDREHTGRVKSGETWLVHPYIHGKATFLIPIERVELSRLLPHDEELRSRDSCTIVSKESRAIGALGYPDP